MPGPLEEIQLEATPGQWTLRRADPSPELVGLVKEFWEVEGALAPFRETILPNGWTEAMFSLGPPHRVLSGVSTGVWNGAWYSGLHEGAIAIESQQGTHLVSARMHPLGALELLGLKAPACANRVVGLNRILGTRAKGVEAAVRQAATPAARFAVLENFLIGHRDASRGPSSFVGNAARRIEAAHGALRVSEMHEEANVSRRYFVSSFKSAVGVTPRAYAKIHRFVWTLERLRDGSAIEWSRLAAEAGYSDQSHLIRDFRRVGGTSAGKYLPRLAPGGIALWGVGADEAS